jgi:nucleoside-diphosphate-sugar epimerase
MKVLVIGGNRFVGHQLAARLVAARHRVTLLNRGTLPDHLGDRVERLHADRTTAEFERALAGRSFDAAVDFAAFTGDDTRRAAEALDGRVGHYVMISSGQVYLVRDPRPAGACRESDYGGPLMAQPVDPRDAKEWDYGMGKRDAEDALLAAHERRGFPSTCLRIPMVNGERDYHRRLDGYLWRFLDGGPVLLPDGATHQTRHVYAGAVARALGRLLGDPRTFGQALNFAQDETPTLVELLGLVAELLGAPARFVCVPRPKLEASGLDPVQISPFSGRWMSFLDPARARDDFGLPHDPLRHYLDKIVSDFLNHPRVTPPPGYVFRAAELAVLEGLE